MKLQCSSCVDNDANKLISTVNTLVKNQWKQRCWQLKPKWLKQEKVHLFKRVKTRQKLYSLNNSAQNSINSHPQLFQCRLIRFGGWKHRHITAEHHPVCDLTMWPCGLSTQMATFLSACVSVSLPVSLSPLTRHGSYSSDSSLSPSAN